LHLLRLAQDRALTPPASPIEFTTLMQSPEKRLKETLDVEYIILVMYGGLTELGGCRNPVACSAKK
jgi:hypothetical protein